MIVEEMPVIPELRAIKPGILPDPLAASPIAVLELVQLYVVPDRLLLKLVGGTLEPAHTVVLAGPLTRGNGLTVIV